MKCALEIMMIKEEAEKAYAFEQARLDEKCKIKHAEIVANTIKFCEETISLHLEELAATRQIPSFYIEGVVKTDRIGNEIFYPLEEEGYTYANGQKSYRYNSEIAYDVKTMTTYVEQFCFSTKWWDTTYKRYGWGECKSREFKVFIE